MWSKENMSRLINILEARRRMNEKREFTSLPSGKTYWTSLLEVNQIIAEQKTIVPLYKFLVFLKGKGLLKFDLLVAMATCAAIGNQRMAWKLVHEYLEAAGCKPDHQDYNLLPAIVVNREPEEKRTNRVYCQICSMFEDNEAHPDIHKEKMADRCPECCAKLTPLGNGEMVCMSKGCRTDIGEVVMGRVDWDEAT